ncbi:MAG: virulence RhuM family protein [Desulfobacterales bacterium]|nr:virulence RhuM family protein [Desulfobacterales bacterium]
MSKDLVSDENSNSGKGQFLVYEAEDGRVKIDVRLEDETVWLTQQMMAELFQTTVPNINMHTKNIFEEGELRPEATIKKFLTVRREGKRNVRRELDFYNLDMIISVGYWVKSHVATRSISKAFSPEERWKSRQLVSFTYKFKKWDILTNDSLQSFAGRTA